MMDLAWVAVAIIGLFVFLDGIGSILILGGQFHGRWFDLEREVRAAGGFLLIVIAVARLLQGA